MNKRPTQHDCDHADIVLTFPWEEEEEDRTAVVSTGQQLACCCCCCCMWVEALQSNKSWRHYVNLGGPSKAKGSCVEQRWQLSPMLHQREVDRGYRGAELQKMVAAAVVIPPKQKSTAGVHVPQVQVTLFHPCVYDLVQRVKNVKFCWTHREGTLESTTILEIKSCNSSWLCILMVFRSRWQKRYGIKRKQQPPGKTFSVFIFMFSSFWGKSSWSCVQTATIATSTLIFSTAAVVIDNLKVAASSFANVY